MSFYEQIGIDPSTDIRAVLIFKYMNAEAQDELKWSEFMEGCKQLSADSIDSWKSVALPRLSQEIGNESKFKDLYKTAFGFNVEEGKKNIDIETACAIWQLFIKPEKCRFLNKWIQFLQGKNER